VKIRDGRIEGIEDGPAHHASAPPAVVPGSVTEAAETKEAGDKAGTKEAEDKAGSVKEISPEDTAAHPEPDPVKTDLPTMKREKHSTGIFGKRKVQSK
jgi:hypothetical protein